MFETDPTIDVATRSKRVKEVSPLSDKHVPFPLIQLEAVALDPGPSHAPSPAGTPLASYKNALLQLYLWGGTGGGPVNRTVTVTIEGTIGLTMGGVVQWIDISKSCLDLNTGLSGVASWAGTGIVLPSEYLLAFGSLNLTHVRLAYDWDGDPDAGAGKIIAWIRERAL